MYFKFQVNFRSPPLQLNTFLCFIVGKSAIFFRIWWNFWFNWAMPKVFGSILMAKSVILGEFVLVSCSKGSFVVCTAVGQLGILQLSESLH